MGATGDSKVLLHQNNVALPLQPRQTVSFSWPVRKSESQRREPQTRFPFDHCIHKVSSDSISVPYAVTRVWHTKHCELAGYRVNYYCFSIFTI